MCSPPARCGGLGRDRQSSVGRVKFLRLDEK
jgi:hypothetical protein